MILYSFFNVKYNVAWPLLIWLPDLWRPGFSYCAFIFSISGRINRGFIRSAAKKRQGE